MLGRWPSVRSGFSAIAGSVRSGAELAQHGLDLLLHRGGVERLDHVIVDAGLDRRLDHFGVALAGCHDERHALGQRIAADGLQQGQAVHPVHVPVGDDQVELVRADGNQSFGAALGFDNILDADLLQAIAGNAAHAHLVVDNQNPKCAGRRHIAPRSILTYTTLDRVSGPRPIQRLRLWYLAQKPSLLNAVCSDSESLRRHARWPLPPARPPSAWRPWACRRPGWSIRPGRWSGRPPPASS